MKIKLLSLVIASYFLSGCATLSQQRNSIIEKIPENKRAYILGKYSVECSPVGTRCSQYFNSISLNYTDKEKRLFPGQLRSVQGSIFGQNTDYDILSLENREKGFYFCQPLPSESYEFYSFNYYNFSGGGSGYYLSEENYFSLPFKLEEGEVYYIGNLKMTLRKGKNAFGMTLNLPGNLELSNGKREDIDKALEKCPINAKNKMVKTLNLDPNLNPHPFVKNIN